jgi:hypothetical protein
MANVVAPYEIPAPIAQRLRVLRGHITTWFLIDGLGRVLLLALGIFAIDLLLDWTFRLDRSLRSVMWVLMAGAIAVIAWRRLLLPLTTVIGDDALLLEVERKHKFIGEGIISAAQFARISDLERLGVSQSMVEATINYGVEGASRIQFGDVLNRKRYLTNVLLLAAAVLLVVGLGAGVAMGGPLAIWFNRNLLLGNAHWPQETYLEIVGAKNGVVTLPRGESWTQLVRVTEDSAVVPDTVFVDFYPADGRPSQTMKKLPNNEFEVAFANVIEEFRFRARGGDAVTDLVQVQLVEPPAVDKLKLTVTLPEYTGNLQDELPPGKGPYYVLKGSTLNVGGVANKPLSKAVVVIERTVLEGSPQPPVRIPLTVSDGANFSGTLSASQVEPGKYVLELTDEGGLTSKRPTSFSVQSKTDREPRFGSAKLVGVSGMVVPQSIVPYAARVTDDYSVTKVRMGYRWRGETTDSGDSGYVDPESLAEAKPAPSVDVEDTFELNKLTLQPGSSITLFIEASDNDNVSGPNVGKSPDFLLRVVTEEQLRTDLLRREKEQRQELERLLKNQEDLILDTQVLAAGAGDTADFTDEQRLTVMALQKRQNLIATNVAGIANVIDSITTEVMNNRLEEPNGKLESRLREKIIAPLRSIANEGVKAAIAPLERSRRVSKEAAERSEALGDAKVAQEAIVKTMKDILLNMAKAEGYQEAINLLIEVERAQKEAMTKTQEELKRKEKNVLEGNKGKTPAEEKPTDKPTDPAPPAEQPQDAKPAEETKKP